MIRRRHALVAVACALAEMPTHGEPKPMAFQAVATPEPMAQIAAGGSMSLLGVSANGALFEWPLTGGSARRLGGDLDATTPLAVGHGRIVARRGDGALWVLEGARTAVSVQRTLAAAAGLLVLPLAVIAIATDAKGHRVVRLEPSSSGSWSAVARSEITVMPDARPLQVDLDGSGDAGHVVVLGSREGLLTVRSGPQGAQLVLVDADPSASGWLRIAARAGAGHGQPMAVARHRWSALAGRSYTAHRRRSARLPPGRHSACGPQAATRCQQSSHRFAAARHVGVARPAPADSGPIRTTVASPGCSF